MKKKVLAVILVAITTIGLSLTGCPQPQPPTEKLTVTALLQDETGQELFSGELDNFDRLMIPAKVGPIWGSFLYSGTTLNRVKASFSVAGEIIAVDVYNDAKTFEEEDLWGYLIALGIIMSAGDLQLNSGLDESGVAFNTFDFYVSAGVESVIVTATTTNGTAFITSVVREEVENQVFNLTTSTVGQGAVTGAGAYNAGEEVIVTATPASGWSFDYWTVNGTLAYNNPGLVTMASDVELVAVFTPVVQPNKYTLSITTEGQGATTGAGLYLAGEKVTITATPATNWNFDHWIVNGTVGSTNPIAQITMDSDVQVIAVFKQTPPPAENAAVVEFTRNGNTGTMRINPGTFSLRSITADASAAYLPSGATFADISNLGVEIVNLPSPYWYLREYSTGTMTADSWSTTIQLDGVGTDSNGVAKTVALANWTGGRAIPFYTISSVPGRIFSLNTGVNSGTLNSQGLAVDIVGFIWPAN